MKAKKRLFDGTARLVGVALMVAAAGCASPVPPGVAVVPDEARISFDSDDELSELMSVLRSDLTRVLEAPTLPRPAVVQQKPAEAPVPKRLTIRNDVRILPIPVVGITAADLEDNFGASRDGGRRTHRGIDIFARRGTPVVAVTDGTITYVGNQPKGGRSVWLTGPDGMAFFYAHFDRWAPGIYEGMYVRRGDLIGYVGNTGNARRTSPHLHFVVVRDDDAVNPYPLLRSGLVTVEANRTSTLRGGFAAGAQ